MRGFNSILRFIAFHASVVSVLLVTACQGTQTATPPSTHAAEIAAPMAKSVALQVQEVQAKDGKILWLNEEHQLPIVALTLTFRHAGHKTDPASLKGRAGLAVAMLGEGAGSYDTVAFSTKLETLGASIQYAIDEDNVTVHMRSLRSHLDEVLSLLALSLREPRFAGADFERLKKETLVALQASKQYPQVLASEALTHHLYASTAYDIVSTRATVSRLTLKDVQEHWQKFVRHAPLELTVAGDVTPSEVKRFYENVIMLVSDQSLTAPQISIKPVPTDEMLFIHHPTPHAAVFFALQAPMPKDKAYLPFSLASYIVADGQLTSKLMQEVRVKRGLTYGIRGTISRNDNNAVQLGWMATENEKLEEGLRVIAQVMRESAQQGFTTEEMSRATQAIKLSYPIKFRTNEAVANALASYRALGFSKDYINEYPHLLEQVDRETLNQTTAQWFKPGLLFVIVGDKNKIAPSVIQKAKIIAPVE